jgi:hypothetical protein
MSGLVELCSEYQSVSKGLVPTRLATGLNRASMRYTGQPVRQAMRNPYQSLGVATARPSTAVHHWEHNLNNKFGPDATDNLFTGAKGGLKAWSALRYA